MKRLSLCLALIISMALFGSYAFFSCKDCAVEIKQEIESAARCFKNEDYVTATEFSDKAIILWHKLSDRTVFVEDIQNDIEIEMTLARISEMARQQDDDIFEECRVLFTLLDSFIDMQTPTLANIF
ncbi:MAG: DUF4363 family protein [Ruminiclostridium sp.]|nr:DUF4363 family protein [Ruminiclostridium sp.]